MSRLAIALAIGILGICRRNPGARASDPVIAAAGDIACGSGMLKNDCHQQATSDLVVGLNPTAVLTLGDNQYENGALDAFQKSYDPTWGRFKAITFPRSATTSTARGRGRLLRLLNGSAPTAGRRRARATTASTSAPGT